MEKNYWKLDDGRVIRLLTPEELQSLPPDATIICITGDSRKVVEPNKPPADDDTRFGYTAYGTIDTKIPQLETNEKDGMPAIFQGVKDQVFPHTVDARIWAKEWMKMQNKQDIASDEGAMIGWFANAIMAGYDTASYRLTSKI